MLRTRLYGDPQDSFLDHLILDRCRRFSNKLALFDTSSNRRLSYAQYGETVEALARGLVAAGLKPGEVLAIFLSNSWEFCATYHAATLAGAVPTLLNPSYREREVRYQLENSGAVLLVTDGSNLQQINLGGLTHLRRVYCTRQIVAGTEPFDSLLAPSSIAWPDPGRPSDETLAALPYSSGTTGLPKGVMLSHFNLVANLYQLLGPNGSAFHSQDIFLCFLPLYHIYGLNVVLNPALLLGATLVLMPRFAVSPVLSLMVQEGITTMPLVPPAMNALCQAAEAGNFPKTHQVRWVKSGAAPLSPELAHRFAERTGILVCQGYGMTEASPVTHLGYLEPELYHPESIGRPLCQTECRVMSYAEGDTCDQDVACGEAGELVMRGPQFMLGYWREPEATSAALRDGWFWSGDVVSRDSQDFYRVVDRRKEMIKYKGFPVAPAEVESVLLEHPAVRDCAVVGRADDIAGEIPVAFVVLRDSFASGTKVADELCGYVAERLTPYKQPREIRFVEGVPKTASGKILRRELRKILGEPLFPSS
jgi:long-chain acyl-CoA synthetase